MSLPVSARILRINPSPTVALTGRVAQLKAQGKDILSLGAGEPDFDTPKHIREAGIEAINKGLTRYTPLEGTAELKDAIVAKFQRENGLSYQRNQILVSSGGKQTLFNMTMALMEPGDEAIVPAPYWVSYPEMVALAEGVPVIVFAGPEQGYKMTPTQLRDAITPRTRLIFINSPNNPTGAAYTRAELRALGDVLAKHPRIVVCTDDMYEHIYWGDEPFASFAAVCPELYERTVTVNGVSKAYAMTGWRIGYCGGPAEIVSAMSIVQSQSTSNPSSIAQYASLVALNGDQSCVREMNREYRLRHEYLVTELNRLPGISCLRAAGTFYSFANITTARRTLGLESDQAFAEHLLESGVAVVPGSAFGAPGHMRLSFACSMQSLAIAVGRIAAALSTPARRSK